MEIEDEVALDVGGQSLGSIGQYNVGRLGARKEASGLERRIMMRDGRGSEGRSARTPDRQTGRVVICW